MEKIKVLIVDDEILAIEDIIGLFGWQGNGFEVVGTANNGEQVLRKFNKLQPQVVITDIKTPVMNGIELAGAIKKYNRAIRVVFLSGHAEFEHAKQALELGAEEYILKNDIVEESLRQKMLKIKNKIRLDEDKYDLIQQRAVFDIFNANGNISEYSSSSDEKMAEFLKEKYYYFIIEEDQPLPLIANLLPGSTVEDNMLADFIEECMKVSFGRIRTVNVSRIKENRFVIMSSPAEDSGCDEEALIKSYAHKLQAIIEGKFKRTFSIFMMTRRMTIEDAYRVYTKTKSRIYCKYFTGTSLICKIENNENKDTTDNTSYNEVYVQAMIDKHNINEIFKYIDELFETVSKSKSYPGLVIIIRNLLATLEKNSSCLKSATSGKRFELYSTDERDYWLDIDKIRVRIKKKFGELITIIRENSSAGYCKEVIKAMEYVRNNYSRKSLNIKDIGLYVSLSVTRISHIFKKQTNNTILDYITKFRIERAMELLKNGDFKIYEVCEMVGYHSSQYFSQVFFKATGIKPLDYKKRSDCEISQIKNKQRNF